MTEATFVDPDDNPINAFEWGALIGRFSPIHVLAETKFATPVGQIIVRTTWCGLVVPGVSEPYGTASATSPDGPWIECEQYRTRAAALAGHLGWAARVGAAADPATEGS